MAKVLLVIPHDRFRDEEFTTINTILKEKGHEISIGSSHHTEAQGHFGLLVKPDINVSFVEPVDFEALIFIGGRGIDEYIENSSIYNLVRAFFYENKTVAALGRAVEILAYAGILVGKRVTCDILTTPVVQSAGGYYTGGRVESDGLIITGDGVDAREEFAISVAKSLEYRGPRGGLYHAGTA